MTILPEVQKMQKAIKQSLKSVEYMNHHHNYHVQEGLGLIPIPFILKMKLVPPSLPQSSYVSLFFWFILQCLFRYPVCVHPLYVLQPLYMNQPRERGERQEQYRRIWVALRLRFQMTKRNNQPIFAQIQTPDFLV